MVAYRKWRDYKVYESGLIIGPSGRRINGSWTGKAGALKGLQTEIRSGLKRRRYMLGRIVAAAWCGLNMEDAWSYVAHIDGDVANNALWNLNVCAK